MKRAFCLIVAIMLVMSFAAGAEGLFGLFANPAATREGRDAALAAAFDTGNLNVQWVYPAPALPAELHVAVPDSFWKFAGETPVSDDEIAATIRQQAVGIAVMSTSPDGGTMLGQLNGMPIAISKDGTVALIHPNPERGVPDEYGRMEKIFGRELGMMIDDEGVVWSPDGHYAMILNYKQAVINARNIMSAMLIDTRTGEMFMFASYGEKPRDDNYGTLTAACFSADGKGLYYLLRGSVNDEGGFLLMYYDLESGNIQQLLFTQRFYYSPRLWELPDGSLIALEDNNGGAKHCGVTRFARVNGQWQAQINPLGMEIRVFYARRLWASRESGRAVVTGHLIQNFEAAMCFDTRASAWDLNHFWLFETDNPLAEDLSEFRLVSMTQDQLMAMPEAVDENGNHLWSFSGLMGSSAQQPEVMPGQKPFELFYRPVMTATLSPGGEYALMTTAINGKVYGSVVRLSDMACVPLKPELFEQGGVTAINLGAERYSIEWHEDGLWFFDGKGTKHLKFDYMA